MNDYDVFEMMRNHELNLRRTLPRSEQEKPETLAIQRWSDYINSLRVHPARMLESREREEFPSVHIDSEIRVKK